MTNEQLLARIEELEESALEQSVLMGIIFSTGTKTNMDEALVSIFTNPENVALVHKGMKDVKNVAVLDRVVKRFALQTAQSPSLHLVN